jgi:hypothetical protein
MWLFKKYLTVGVVGAIGVLYAFLALLPLQTLLVETLPDDAFYYFHIARHIAAGEGSTFDGVTETNGYHPLWMITIVPIFSVLSQGGTFDVAPIHAVLLVASLLATMTALLLRMIFRRIGLSEGVSAVLLLIFFTNPFVVYAYLNGLETALVLFLLTSLALCAQLYQDRRTYTYLVALGVSGGFLMLARLDTVFYFVALLGWVLYIHDFPKRVFDAVRPVVIVGVVSSVIVVPFLLLNYTTFGMLLTSASIASTEVNRGLTISDNGDTLVTAIRAPLYMLVRALGDVLRNTGAPIIVLLLVGYAIARFRDFSLARNAIPSLWWFLFAGGMTHLLVSAAVRYTWRDWYFIPINIVLIIAGSYVIAALSKKESLRTVAALGLVLSILGSYVVMWEKYVQHRERVQADMFAATEWASEHLPEGSVIGVFNAGIHGYFSRHTVVNLDGLVNNAAAEAIQKRALWNYVLNEARVTHVADFPLYFEYRFKPFFGTSTPLDGFDEVYATGESGVHVYAR